MPELNGDQDMFGQPAQTARAQLDRSPNYPLINLEAAVERAAGYFGEFSRATVPVPTVIQFWKMSPKSSGGRMLISALVKFGLLEESGRGPTRTVRISQLALDVLRPDSEEKGAAIQRAALTPTVHADLWKKWGANLPSDSSLRFYLASEMKFTPTGAEELAREYRETLTYAKLIGPDTRDGSGGDAQAPRQMTPAAQPAMAPAAVNAGPSHRVAEDKAMPTQQEPGRAVNGEPVTKPAGLSPVREEVINVSDGQITLRWPQELSPRNLRIFERWVALLVENRKPDPSPEDAK